MRIPRIYTPQPLSADTSVALDEQASHYVGRVLRMQGGRPLILFNGEGGEFEAVIGSVDKREVRVDVGRFIAVERESPLHIHLGIGVSRGERMDWVLQKATELGVSAITPLLTERCEVKLTGPRLEKKVQHWQQILTSACEQCQRNRLPQLHEPMKLDSWIGTLPDAGEEHLRLVLHHRSEGRLQERARPQSAALVIGPEGGLSDAEINDCLQHRFAPLTLGPRVLRTETAPLTAISVLQFLWGDLAG